MDLNRYLKSLWQLLQRDKAKRRIGINVLLGVAIGIMVLTVPSTLLGYAWQARLFELLLKFGAIFSFLTLAAIAAAAAYLLPSLRSSMLANKLAFGAANRACALALNAALVLVGLSIVVAFCHDAHTLSILVSVAVWLLALRQFVIEQASGAPRMKVAAACSGWMCGLTFQSDITHFMVTVMHHV